jgi:hypothetical protein
MVSDNDVLGRHVCPRCGQPKDDQKCPRCGVAIDKWQLINPYTCPEFDSVVLHLSDKQSNEFENVLAVDCPVTLCDLRVCQRYTCLIATALERIRRQGRGEIILRLIEDRNDT